jgi:hypothetical protein
MLILAAGSTFYFLLFTFYFLNSLMRIIKLFLCFLLLSVAAGAQKNIELKKKDRKRDVLIQTNFGDMVVRLSDSTPLHRDNFLKLVKAGLL